jgi:hypothetical protein
MTNHNAANERVKRRYFTYLAEAQGYRCSVTIATNTEFAPLTTRSPGALTGSARDSPVSTDEGRRSGIRLQVS